MLQQGLVVFANSLQADLRRCQSRRGPARDGSNGRPSQAGSCGLAVPRLRRSRRLGSRRQHCSVQAGFVNAGDVRRRSSPTPAPSTPSRKIAGGRFARPDQRAPRSVRTRAATSPSRSACCMKCSPARSPTGSRAVCIKERGGLSGVVNGRVVRRAPVSLDRVRQADCSSRPQ